MLNNGGIQSLATVEFPQTYDPFIAVPVIPGEQSLIISVKIPESKHQFSLNVYDNGCGCLTLLSIIFQLYHHGQCYWCMKLMNPEKIADVLKVTDTPITYIKLRRADLATHRSRIVIIVQS